MRNISFSLLVIAGLAYGFAFQTQKTPPPPPPADLIKLTAGVSEIFQQSCATAGCHRGQYAKKQLNLEADKFMTALVDVVSKQVDSLKLVDRTNPQKSYLLMKIRGDKGMLADRMPIDAPPLTSEALKTVEKWVQSLATVAAAKVKKETPPPSDSKKKTTK